MHRVRVPALVAAGLSALLLLTACTGGAQRREQERLRYESYAGAPIEEFTWLGRYDGWNSLGNDELVLWTNGFDAYLIKVVPPCIDLPFAERIGLTSTVRTVNRRFDFVIVHREGERGPGSNWRCPIAEIRPVDYRRMLKDAREHGTKVPATPRHPGQAAQAGTPSSSVRAAEGAGG